MRIPDPTRFVPCLVRLGWATTTVPNPEPHRARGRVYFFRGQALVFSRGFGRMCDELRRQGVWAEDLRCRGETWACRHILADRRAGKLHGPVIFVGHSCGGRSTVFAAQRLQAAGVGVELIVCLDTAVPPPVPANVRRAVHLYWAGPRLYPARPLVAAPGVVPVIENIDQGAAESPIAAAGLWHMNITASPAVQAFVTERVREAVSQA
jgi:hypothetical protein